MQIIIYFSLLILGVILGMTIMSILDQQNFAEYRDKIKDILQENSKLRNTIKQLARTPEDKKTVEFVISDDSVGKNVDFGGF